MNRLHTDGSTRLMMFASVRLRSGQVLQPASKAAGVVRSDGEL
ncbi:hypothetical protein ACFL3Q_16310 [Planctomycetota bacterium]